jgi:hypothetical protein
MTSSWLQFTTEVGDGALDFFSDSSEGRAAWTADDQSFVGVIEGNGTITVTRDDLIRLRELITGLLDGGSTDEP